MIFARKLIGGQMIPVGLGTPIVLITGGSQGIGLALARGFASRGYNVFLVARDAARMRAAAENIETETGVYVRSAAVDLSHTDALAEIDNALEGQGCYPDILVNCAASGMSDDFIKADAQQANDLLAVNVIAATNLMRAYLPGMIQRGRGGVLNIASLAGLTPMPYLALYAASKSYMLALSRAVATEVAGSRVTVSVVLPGPVNTRFLTDNVGASPGRTGFLPGLSADAVARTAIDGFLAGQAVITPGVLGALCRVGLNFLPYHLLGPLLGWAARGFTWSPLPAVNNKGATTLTNDVSADANHAVARLAER